MCGNYGNLLSHFFFCKISVKALFLLKKVLYLIGDLTKYLFSAKELKRFREISLQYHAYFINAKDDFTIFFLMKLCEYICECKFYDVFENGNIGILSDLENGDSACGMLTTFTIQICRRWSFRCYQFFVDLTLFFCLFL